ncbi:hypothetical protein ACFV8T_44910 [Streptomyces sp. NPDC059832]
MTQSSTTITNCSRNIWPATLRTFNKDRRRRPGNDCGASCLSC